MLINFVSSKAKRLIILKLKSRLNIYLLALIFTFPWSVQGQDNGLHTKIDAIAYEYISKKSTRALVVGYCYNGKSYTKYYGETEKGNSTLPTETSVFEIGSVTKLFTATLLAQLEQKQLLTTDDELKAFLPSDVILPLYQKLICKPDKDVIGVIDDPDYDNVKFRPFTCVPDPKSVPQEIKLCYLASHTAGFPLNPSNLRKGQNKNDPFAHYTKDKLYAYLKNHRVYHSLGTEYKYSNTGYAVLGHAMEINQKKSIGNLFKEFIWNPLSMNSSTLASTGSSDMGLLKGHKKSGKAVGAYHYNIMNSAMGIRSTSADMMKFLEANLNIKEHELSNAVVTSHQARLKIDKKGLRNSEVALGWFISPLENNIKVVWHSGASAGHSMFIGFIQNSKNGIVVMANNYGNLSELSKQILVELNANSEKK